MSEDAVANSKSAVLAVHGCTFAYDRDVVLRNVSMQVAPGRVLVLAGPNGAGKSTLLKVLAGLIEHPSAVLAGKPMGAWSNRERADRVAYVPQAPSVAFGFLVRDVVAFGLPEGMDAARGGAAIDGALEQVGLGVVAGKAFAHLSAGQQQRVALARAMVRLCFEAGRASEAPPGHDLAGKALLADEPTSAQDPHHAVRTVGLLRGLAARGAGVIVVMHDLSLAMRLGDDAIVLACDGQIAAEGPVREALGPERLRGVFGVDFALAQTARGGVALIAGETAEVGSGPLPSATAKDRS